MNDGKILWVVLGGLIALIIGLLKLGYDSRTEAEKVCTDHREVYVGTSDNDKNFILCAKSDNTVVARKWP